MSIIIIIIKADGFGTELGILSDCARHFLNHCGSYKVAKMVHGNRSDNHCSTNWSDTQPSIDTAPRAVG